MDAQRAHDREASLAAPRSTSLDINLLPDVAPRRPATTDDGDDALPFHLFDGLQEAVCLVTRRLRIRYWNPEMARLSGVPARAARGNHLYEVLPRAFKHYLEPAVQSFLQAAAPAPVSGEFRHDFNSHQFAIRYKLSQVGDVAAEPLLLCTFADLTDSYRLAKVRELREHVTTLGDLSISIAQELAAPLNKIFRHVEDLRTLLGEQIGSLPGEALDGVVNQIYRISFLAHNLIALSNNSQPNAAKIRLHEVILEAIDACEQEEARSLPLNLQLDDDVPEVIGDPAMLALALKNLLKIAEECAGEDAIPRLSTTYDPAESIVKVIIEDRGDGLTQEALHNLFELCRDVSSISPGATLGLFISKKLLEAQHCRFDMYTDENAGTVFALTLPVLSTQAPRDEAAA